jgi:hypothetical protein
MQEFNGLKSGATEDSNVLKFFADINDGLKEYYENVNLLSNGAKFYKQMH